MRKILLFVLLGVCSTMMSQQPTTLNVDAGREKGDMKPIWAWFGYDEPNYTYMKYGKKLLSEIAEMSPTVYVRAHNLMTSGDGTPALKWGSTNIYTEDVNGQPVYTWNIIDSIFDTYVRLHMRPLVEIGFMPEALSTHPQPYRHHWQPGHDYKEICTGWAYPPKDYTKWAELIYQWVKHCNQRYGKDEVEKWYWELWNEPDGDYLMVKDKVKTYCKMYDYASDAVKRALPSARIGGPHTTGGGRKFLKTFIQHCISDTNAVTGKIGAPLDFIGFHAKGRPSIVDKHVRMSIQNQLRDVYENLKIVSSFPQTKRLPVIIGESDPEGCAACGMETDPQNAYRNGTMYSSYTAASIPRIMDINDYWGTNVIGAVNWSFEFEGEPWFYGFRELATNGVDKPVLNVFRMMSMMKGKRIEVSGNTTCDFNKILKEGDHGYETDVNALATKDAHSIAVMAWNYHDDDVTGKSSELCLCIKNIPAKKVRITNYSIDTNHSNSYEVWKKMGEPVNPSSEQYIKLENAGKLETTTEEKKMTVKNGELQIKMKLPRQAVCLTKLTF